MSIVSVRTALALLASLALLGGCAAAQRMVEGGSALFSRPVTTLHLDFSARPALNTDPGNMQALAVPTLVRVYQLRDAAALARLDFHQVQDEDSRWLKADLLGEHEVIVKPGEGAQLSVPLAAQAQVVALVALFRAPDPDSASWRLLLSREQLDPERPQRIELDDRVLSLKGPALEAS